MCCVLLVVWRLLFVVCVVWRAKVADWFHVMYCLLLVVVCCLFFGVGCLMFLECWLLVCVYRLLFVVWCSLSCL